MHGASAGGDGSMADGDGRTIGGVLFILCICRILGRSAPTRHLEMQIATVMSVCIDEAYSPEAEATRMTMVMIEAYSPGCHHHTDDHGVDC